MKIHSGDGCGFGVVYSLWVGSGWIGSAGGGGVLGVRVEGSDRRLTVQG